MEVSRKESIAILLDTIHANYLGGVHYDPLSNVVRLDDDTRIFITWDNVVNWIKDSINHGK